MTHLILYLLKYSFYETYSVTHLILYLLKYSFYETYSVTHLILYVLKYSFYETHVKILFSKSIEQKCFLFVYRSQENTLLYLHICD